MSVSPRANPPVSWEKVVLTHVGIFLFMATWGYGGNSTWVKGVLAWWGLLGVLIIPSVLLTDRRRVSLGRLAWLVPCALFNLLVLASAFTPGLRIIHRGREDFYTPVSLSAWQPSAAVPALALRGLWLFDAIYLSCFNLAWIVRRRRALRGLLLFAVGNALVLSIFGTVQKLLGAPGVYFGYLRTRQEYFFASFLYHNHWGAFIVLMVATCLGLVWHYGRRRQGERDLFHTPAFGGLVAVAFLAATAPLSASRSCTILMGIVLGGAFTHWVLRLARQRRQYKESVWPPLVSALVAGLLAISGAAYLASQTIAARFATTKAQVADMVARGGIGSRWTLYQDTWRMAGDRRWFGWGMDSYPIVFHFYNSQAVSPVDYLTSSYHDAHNDWVQSAAEHGLIGTALLSGLALVPLVFVWRRPPRSPLPAYLLAGCALIVLYSLVEFPFGNTGVVLTWWVCFFTAAGYTRLQHNADAADAAAGD
jgi:O-antigen ligase